MKYFMIYNMYSVIIWNWSFTCCSFNDFLITISEMWHGNIQPSVRKNKSKHVWMFAPVICLHSLQMLELFATVSLLVQNVVVMFHSDQSWFLEEGLYLPWWCLLKFIPLKNTVPLFLDSTSEFSFCHMFWIMSSDNAKRIIIFSPLSSLLLYIRSNCRKSCVW